MKIQKIEYGLLCILDKLLSDYKRPKYIFKQMIEEKGEKIVRALLQISPFLDLTPLFLFFLFLSQTDVLQMLMSLMCEQCEHSSTLTQIFNF